MKIKLLILMFLLFFVENSFSQNTVTYSSLNNTINLNSGIEGTVDVLVNCYGSNSTPVILNALQSCGNNDGILSQIYTNGSILTPGQNTTIRFKFKKTVTADTQIVYKFSTNGSCFQEESKMIKITVNYKAASTINPKNPILNTNITIIKDYDGSIVSNFTINEGEVSPEITLTSWGWISGYNLQWQIKIENGVWTSISGEVGRNYLPGKLLNTASYRITANKRGYEYVGNEVTITVNPAPVLQNNTITLSGSTIIGSVPTGGINSYEYLWELWGGEDPYLMLLGTEQNFELDQNMYDYLKIYPGLAIRRYVNSGRQTNVSSLVRILPISDIGNNIISINGYKVIGSIPTGGGGDYKYSWFLGSQEDPILFEETTKDLDLTPNIWATRILENDHTSALTRTVISGKRSISNKVNLYGKSPLKLNLEMDSLLVHPNPSSESVNFSTNFLASKQIEIVVYSERSLEGKSVFKGTVTPNQVVKWNVPSNYQKGLYFYKILSGNEEIKTGKILYQ
jgi:hypothetical protein